MIVSRIMQSIWGERRQKYYKQLEFARSMSANELYLLTKNKKMPFYSYPQTNMNLFTCGVCTYRKNNHFAGCSMCDYEDENLIDQANMTALREKNVNLFVQAVVNNFINTRGERCSPNLFELLSSYDVFSEEEFPEELFYELFVGNTLFSKQPFCYVFETRASSITDEKLKVLKKYLPKNSRVIIEFGVETSNEWIRNHWLNKGVCDNHIHQAIESIHCAGYRSSADVLIGLPGLLEHQSMRVFADTVFWLENAGIDQMIILPLNRKKLTLQGAMYKYLSQNAELLSAGITHGEHTGVPWLTTVVCAIYFAIKQHPWLLNKINIAQIYSHQNTVRNITSYNKDGCDCNKIIIDGLSMLQNKRDYGILQSLAEYSMSGNHNCHIDYLDLIKRQGDRDIPSTLKMIIRHLTPYVLSTDNKEIEKEFDNELSQYKE